MGNTAGVRHYFLEAFTPYGYISLLPELMKEMKGTYYLTGGPGTGKSTMIKLIGIQLIDRGYEVDYIRSVREPDSVAGLFLPRQRICLLDKKEFVSEGNAQGEYQRVIDFDTFCRQSRLEQHSGRIRSLEASLKVIEQQIIEQLHCDYAANAIEIPSEFIQKDIVSIESVLAAEDDTPNLDEITAILSKIKKNNLYYHFLHGLHTDSWLNLAPRYIRDFDRICLEGENSANLLRDILQEVKCLGQVMEIIVHPLKPYTIVGIVFPEKNLAVWKGNPCKMEEQGFIKKHDTNMMRILERYKKARIELKGLINDAVNFRNLDELRSELLSSILADLKGG